MAAARSPAVKRLLAPTLAVAALVFGPPTIASAHGGGGGPPPTEALAIATAWHVDLPVIAGLVVTALLYVEAVRSVNAAHPGNRWPRRRTTAFLAALVAIGFALLSPVDTLSDDLLTVHMVQHLLLVAVAAPLFAASGIGTLALAVRDADVRKQYLLPFLHSRVVTALTFPVVGWLAFAGVMWGSHLLDSIQRGAPRRRHPCRRAPALPGRGMPLLVAAVEPGSAALAPPSGRQADRAPGADAPDELSRDHDRRRGDTAVRRVSRPDRRVRHRRPRRPADRRVAHVADRRPCAPHPGRFSPGRPHPPRGERGEACRRPPRTGARARANKEFR